MATNIPPGPLIPESESWLSRMTFSYMNKIVDKGLRQTLEYEDLHDIPSELQYSDLFPRFQTMYEERLRKTPRYPIGSAIMSFLKLKILWQAFLVVVATLFDLSVPLQIKFFIVWISDPYAEWWVGFCWALGICICYMLKINISRRGWHATADLTYSIGVIIRGAVFSKLTRSSREGLSNVNVGLITMVMNHDAMKLQILPRPMNFLYVLPIISVAGFIYLYIYFNWMAVFFPLLAVLWVCGIMFTTKYLYKHLQQILLFSDKRSKLVTESLGFIKNIKFECWEENILAQLGALRDNETKSMSKYFLLRNLMVGFTENFSPAFLLCFLSFYSSFYSAISLDQAYFLVSLSGMVMMPLTAFVSFIDAVTSSRAALQRVDKLMGIPEIPHVVTDDQLSRGTVLLEQLSAGWHTPQIVEYFASKSNPNALCLTRINLEFPSGSMSAVIGKVGSGKTALLNGILGDLSIKSGTVKRNGSVAYVSQAPFLLNTSIRDNILFGEPFQLQKYTSVIVKCRLLEDLKILAAGDRTEIGERGINLSGGQKQRIALARALYADKDIYLIDDALSALDPQVATRILDDVILGQLKASGKTVILVTHSLRSLNSFDKLVLLDGGEVAAQGTHAQVIRTSHFLEYTQQFAEDSKASKEIPQVSENHESMTDIEFETEMNVLDQILRRDDASSAAGDGKITKAEGKQKGRVAATVYTKYVKLFGVTTFVFAILMFVSFMALRNLSDYWIGYWASNRWSMSGYEYMYVYICFVGCMFILLLLRSVILSTGMRRFGNTINRAMMERVFRRPMSFFDSTPIGVIINRCTKELLDTDLMFNVFLSIGLGNAARMISLVVVLCLTVPFMIVVFVMAIMFLMRILAKSTTVSSDIKRITQVNTAPVISNVAEMYTGMQLFKSYNQIPSAVNTFNTQMSKMLKSDLHDRYMENWMFWRIELIATGLIFSTTFFVYLVKQTDIKVFNSPNALSLAVTWAASSGDLIGFCLMSFAECMKGMSSIERMLEVAESTDLEAERDGARPVGEWPQNSDVSIKHLSMRYRPDLPLVLNDVNFDVMSKQKIGIVGRTGCGKSSVILALKRIVEMDQPGRIMVDGVDMRMIGIKHARDVMTLIPQDSFVMAGNIRSNIDPFHKYSDAQVMQVLVQTQLISSLTEKLSKDGEGHVQDENKVVEPSPHSTSSVLDIEIESGGSNLSHGQKQLLGIARALIKKPKILLMDEATASIDSSTDAIIQQVLKTEFKDSTIITIAHRLSTIIQYDKILVLDSGKMAEFGSPCSLLEDPESYLSQFVGGHGCQQHLQLLSLAHQSTKQHVQTD